MTKRLVLALAALVMATLAAVPPGAGASAPVVAAALVRTTLTSGFQPSSPDPSGLAYLPLSGQLILSDGEVDEMPGIFQGKNLFITSLSGELLSTSTTVAFSQEPTGAAVDIEKNRLFFSDDDRKRIYQVDPGIDGVQGTADDVVASFVTSDFGSSDPEGLAFDSVHRRLYVVDGLDEEVFEIDPGPNGTFDGASGDDLVRHFDTTALGLRDPEGIEYDPANDLLYVLSGSSRRIGEMSREGSLARSIDLSSINVVAPAGLAIAPASNGAAEFHLYVVDRGIDNNTNPDENDGRLYEIAFPPPEVVATPTSSPAPMQTPTAQPIFADVPHGHPYFAVIEWLYRRGFTAGCATNPLRYCPDATMNRAESAVFVERGVHGATYDPAMPSSQVFGDLPLNSWAARWVNGLWEDQYTAGCATNPLMYCPWQGHTRAEGTVLYLRMMYGPGYIPPEPAQQRFVDVPLGAWYARWVEAAYTVNLIPACQSSPELRFCPEDPLSRGLAAHMMFQAKLVPVPTPVPPATPTATPTPPNASPPSAKSTFQSVGIYWSPPEMAADNPCTVRYRTTGTTEWHQGMDLWFDGRSNSYVTPEYRGSLVSLEPGTSYDIELRLTKTNTVATLHVQTWKEEFPIARTVVLPAMSTASYTIQQGGTPSGYILYTHADGGTATINGQRTLPQCITVNASYVIIRGITCVNPAKNGILINNNTHDIVIEENDISGWGSIDSDGWGRDQDSAVYSSWSSRNIERVIIQRNRFHHPASDSNNWSEYRTIYSSYHPSGPQGISFHDTIGNHVIRYNEIFSDADHYFNDIVGGGSNHSALGFPGADSDIYGNRLANCWDDGIEAEGSGRNIRIWGNFVDHCFSMIAGHSAAVGPLYIFRNITGYSQKTDVAGVDPGGGCLAKVGNGTASDGTLYGGGRVYLFHNTTLQPSGIVSGVCNGPSTNLFTRNNLLYVRGSSSISAATDPSNNFDYDLYNGSITGAPSGSEPNGIKGTPVLDPSFDPSAGRFYLAVGSLGTDRGLIIPNFNDGFTGSGPDMGAHERDTSPMEFGVNAYRNAVPQ